MNYKTRGMSDPRGKPRVFFTCHPADFEKAFALLSEDILNITNCAIWYEETTSGKSDAAERTAAMKEMQLFVFAVTPRFLEEQNTARELDLPFAIENHIPILPITLEQGLGYKFSRICAAVQVVNRYSRDATATPYEDVLKTFLDSVLVGDALAEKVRNAFDAYVFLSYRKKDRRHAQRLMHLIHENPEFRDIAIWYDEFLVPGEKYNDAIKDAFQKSSLFTLVVTPSLLEPDNYVERVEFPMARERRDNEKNLEIVPVEMYETTKNDPRTDIAAIEAAYKEIPRVEDEHRKPELDAAFVEALARISRKENDGSAQHRFFIGLAYLCGIDVEINHARAVELITSAAEENCTDATEKLVDMYLTGDGVLQNTEAAIQWQTTLVDQYRQNFLREGSPDTHKGFGTKAFRAMLRLADLQRENGQTEQAIRTVEDALSFSDKLYDEVGIREVERDIAVARTRLGGLYRQQHSLSKAAEQYVQANRIYERMAYELGTARARRDLSINWEHLGDIKRKQNDFSSAQEYYRKALDLRDGTNTSFTARRDRSCALTKLGNICKDQKDFLNSRKYYTEALELDRLLFAEQKDTESRDDLAISMLKLGDNYKQTQDLEKALSFYREALINARENIQYSGVLRYQKTLAACLEKIASASKKAGDAQTTGDSIAEAIDLRQQIVDRTGTAEDKHELAVCLYNRGVWLHQRSDLEKAKVIWAEISTDHPEYKKYFENVVKAIG